MKASLVATGFYSRIQTRLSKDEDLSSELPIIAQVGLDGAKEVVQSALKDYQLQLANSWEPNPKLKEMGKFKCGLATIAQEQLPRTSVTFEFPTATGKLVVKIASAGETFKLTIDAGKNPMATQVILNEFEKKMTLAAIN